MIKIFLSVTMGERMSLPHPITGFIYWQNLFSYWSKLRKEVVFAKMIELVLEKHKGRLMSIKGVVGVAIGKCEGKPCVKVYVVQKTQELLKQIPSSIEGYKVEVQESGEFRALNT